MKTFSYQLTESRSDKRPKSAWFESFQKVYVNSVTWGFELILDTPWGRLKGRGLIDEIR